MRNSKKISNSPPMYTLFIEKLESIVMDIDEHKRLKEENVRINSRWNELGDNLYKDLSHPSILSEQKKIDSVFSSRVLKEKIISFLDNRSVFELRSLSRFFRWSISLNFKFTYGYIKESISKSKQDIVSAEEFAENLEKLGCPPEGEYLSFLIFKFVKKQQKPGGYIHKTFQRSMEILEKINTQDITDFSAITGEDKPALFGINPNDEVIIAKENVEFAIEQLQPDYSPPRDVVKSRNEFFQSTKKEMEDAISSFSKKINQLPETSLRQILNVIYPCFSELFFLSRMVIQEAYEAFSFKDILLLKLFKEFKTNKFLQTNLSKYQNEVERILKESDEGKERLSFLESQVHTLTYKNTRLTESIRANEKYSKETYNKCKDLELQMKHLNDRKEAADARALLLEQSIEEFSAMRKRFMRIGTLIQEYLPDED